MPAHSTLQFLLLVAIGSVLFLFVQCNDGGASSRVLNGIPLKKHEMPWLTPIFDSSKMMSYCTGSVIGKYHVLTAAHCFNNEWVALGAHKVSEVVWFNKIVNFHYLRNGEIYDIKTAPDREEEKMKWHRCDYFPNSPECPPGIDIAVITLEDKIGFSFEFIEKAKLASPCESCCPLCSKNCSFDFTAAGWGDDPSDPEGPTQDSPKKTTMVCDKKTTIDDFHYFTAIDKSDPHDKDVCQGDSGGPLMNKNVIYGTVVSGGPCTRGANTPHGRSGKYANVRHPEIHEFIKSIVSDVEIGGQ